LRIFLSYPSQDRAIAESVCLALRAEGHSVFFDRTDLPAGEEYDARIRAAIERSHLAIFILSPDAVDRGSYTLTEIEIAAKTWPRAGSRVLPVVVRHLDYALLPAYLRSVTVLEPDGNIPATIADAVHRLARGRWKRHASIVASGLATIAAIVAVLHFFFPASLQYLSRGLKAELTGNDGAPALLIEAGEFLMGDGEDEPLRQVYVDAFYIDKYEVSLSQYAKFLEAHGGVRDGEYWSAADAARYRDLPVFGVSWRDADAYCRSLGKRLPTEAEWEKAARGVDGRVYPWGNEQPDSERANFAKGGGKPFTDGLATVQSFESGASPYGVYNLAGNVSEWVADWYAESFRTGDTRNPKGPESGTGKVLRGGGWYDGVQALRSTKRYFANPDIASDDRGFRCARDAPK
jgi:formylglycine-generating enzyme required for sulfatase activity